MLFKDLVHHSRSRRRFDESFKVDRGILESLVELARLSPSGANRQPLKFLVYNTPDFNSIIFANLQWAGYLKEWVGPAEGERPSAYIIILGDKTISEQFGVDHGIAAQSIMLGATEAGLGGCIIGSINKENLRSGLSIPGYLDILLVLALGKPVENIILDEIVDGDVRYWRDSEGNHHVPKRSTDELIIRL